MNSFAQKGLRGPAPRSDAGLPFANLKLSFGEVALGFKLRRLRKGYLAVSLMLGLWLVLTVLSTSPQLHHWFHHDSAAPAHDCLITSLSKGNLIAVGQPMTYAPPQSTVVFWHHPPVVNSGFVSYSEPLTRGPPNPSFPSSSS
jgi:hypothetical protein